MTKVIFESKRPRFAIIVDDMQWILAKTKKSTPNGDRWTNRTFHPNLCNLLDHLAEYEFKRNAKKVDQLLDLDEAVAKVYRLISRVAGKLDVKVTIND